MAEDPQPDSTAPNPPALSSLHHGHKDMPAWNVDTLLDAPTFTSRNWFEMLGPGLIMSGAAIGGGEWLVDPKVTVVHAGPLLWLATLSVLGQVIYNTDISR